MTLPFQVMVYGTPYTSVFVGSNGMLNFGADNPNIYTANCLPVLSNPPAFSGTLFAYYDDLRTDVLPATHGVYSTVIGVAPNRQFVLKWQATYFDKSITQDANFEVVMSENSSVLTVIYGSTATMVVPTACPIQFADVLPDNVFYPFIRCLACRKIANGYPCGGPGEPCNANGDGYFRPGNDVLRGQIAKMVAIAAGFGEDPGPQIFTDVPVSNPFFPYINRLTNRGLMSGYPCGGFGDPCDPQNRPYFHPFANATRGQVSKIVANAAGLNDPIPAGTQTYTDVLPSNPFYVYIERLTALGVMGGYLCGGPGEPCDSQNRPYFRPFVNITRAQTAKIVANTFFPNCQTPSEVGEEEEEIPSGGPLLGKEREGGPASLSLLAWASSTTS